MSIPGRTLSAWRGRIFLATWTLYAGYYVCRKDVAVSDDAAVFHFALTLAFFGAAYALGQLVGGTLVDRLGPYDLGREFLDSRIGVLAVGGLDNGESVPLEGEREHFANGVLVVDEQDRGRWLGHEVAACL